MPPKGSKHVMYNWTVEAERILILTSLAESNFESSQGFYERVAQNLGGQVTAKGVRYGQTRIQDQESEIITFASSH